MADPQTPQPQGGDFVWAKLPGDKWAKFPKGTTQEQVRQQLTARGLLKPKSTGNPAEDYLHSQGLAGKEFGTAKPDPKLDTWSHVGKKAVEGLQELGQAMWNTGKDIVNNPDWVFGKNSVYEHVVGTPAEREANIASAAWKLHQYDRAAIHELGGMIPLAGPWIAEGLYEGLNTKDPWGNLAKFESQMLGAEATSKAISKLKLPTREGMRQSAARLDALATKPEIDAKALTDTERAQAGRAMAEARVRARRQQLPKVLDDVIKRKTAQMQQQVQAATAAGKAEDVASHLDNAVNVAKQRAAALGDKRALDQLDRWKAQQQTFLNPVTKQTAPVNLRSVSPAWLLEKSRLLEHGVWEGGKMPEHIELAQKLFRQGVNDALDRAVPGTAKMRADVSDLIKNREGAKAIADKAFQEQVKTFISYFKSPGTLISFAAMRALGASWIGAIAPIVGVKTLWDSTLSRTARAAALQWASELFDGSRQSAVNGGGRTGGGGGTPAPPNLRPTQGPPFAPATVVQQNAGPGGQTGPFATFQAVWLAKQLLPPSAPLEQVMVAAQQIKATQALQRAIGPQTGGNAPTGGEAPITQSGAANAITGKGLQPPTGGAAPGPPAALPPEVEPPGGMRLPRGYAIRQYPWMGRTEYLVTGPKGEVLTKGHASGREAYEAVKGQLPQPKAEPKVTRVAEGVSGLSPKMKAIMDRFDALLERQAKPKSGKDRIDIERELAELKQIVYKNEGGSGAEGKKMYERMLTRERVAKHRAKQQAATPGQSSTGAVEPTAGGDPEQWTSLIELGLNKLREFGQLGKAAADATAREAKQRKWSPHEQMAHIAEQIEFLKANPELANEK